MADRVRVEPAHRQVENDGEAAAESALPGGGTDAGLADAEKLTPVEIPADLLVCGVTAVNNHRVGLVSLLAAGTRLRPTAEAVRLVARAEGAVGVALGQVPAVQRAGILIEPVDVLQDVDLAMCRPRAGP